MVPTSALVPPPSMWQLWHDSPALAISVERNSRRPSATRAARESAVDVGLRGLQHAGDLVRVDRPDAGVRVARRRRRLRVVEHARGEHDGDDRGDHRRDAERDAHHQPPRAAAGRAAHASAGAGARRLRNSGLAAWQRANTSAKSPAPVA